MFFLIFDDFDILILKIKKYYFNIFLIEKHYTLYH